MVVCKFFQQGSCRYGQNCAYEHVYGSKYNYYANPPAQAKTQQTGITDEQLINQVKTDIEAALKGGQWLLSCYAPFKEKPIFPGLIDLSPEESRLFIYEAKSNNDIDRGISYINNLISENRSKYEQLLQPNAKLVKVLRSLYNGESPSSPFTTQNTESNASTLFRSAVQNKSIFNQNSPSTPSIFSQVSNAANTQAIFTQNNSVFSTVNNQSIFNQNQNSNSFNQPQAKEAKSIFALANQNIFGPQTQSQNGFNNAQNASSIFATASQNVFGPNETRNDSIFPTQQSTNIFQQSTNMNSGQNVFHNTGRDDSAIYSKMEELDETDLEAFKSEDFKLGFVPEIAPPYSLCF